MRPKTTCLAVVCVVLSAPCLVEAQSLLNSGGLGFPIESLDSRSRALGGSGIGLFGPAVLPLDPAAAADLVVPEITLTLQQSWVDLQGPANPTASGARFPLIALAYPLSDLAMITGSFAGYLDQRWNAVLNHDIPLGDGTARVTDAFSSDGGVSTARIALARRFSPRLAVGVSAGRYIGQVTRLFVRSFDSLFVGETVPDFTTEGIWDYKGSTVTASVHVDLGDFLRAAGSVTWSGDLRAEPIEGTGGPVTEFSVPMEFRLGASGALTPVLNIVGGFTYADWSDQPDGFQGRTAFSYGAGVEWEAASFLTDPSPVRLGFRRSRLPFSFEGENADESLFSAGLGFHLVQTNQLPLARVDIGVERGSRTAGILEETFWRASVTFRVAGR